MSETAIVHARSAELARPFEFTAEQRQIIRDTFANGATDSEFAVLMEVAKARRLNPLLKQIYFVKRWDSQKRREVWSTQISIEGLRSVAERTDQYDGQDEPDWQYDKDGKLLLCRVKVYRKGVPRPFVGVAHFSEYVQMTKEGKVTKFWSEKPHVMISKCAEAVALRKGFPEDTADLYIPEEMQGGVEESPITAPPVPSKLPESVDADFSEAPTEPVEMTAEEQVAEYKEKIAEAPTLTQLTAVGAALSKKPEAVRNALREAYKMRREMLTSAGVVPNGAGHAAT